MRSRASLACRRRDWAGWQRPEPALAAPALRVAWRLLGKASPVVAGELRGASGAARQPTASRAHPGSLSSVAASGAPTGSPGLEVVPQMSTALHLFALSPACEFPLHWVSHHVKKDTRAIRLPWLLEQSTARRVA